MSIVRQLLTKMLGPAGCRAKWIAAEDSVGNLLLVHLESEKFPRERANRTR